MISIPVWFLALLIGFAVVGAAFMAVILFMIIDDIRKWH